MLLVILRTVLITLGRYAAPGKIAAGALAAFAFLSFNAQAQQVAQQGWPASVLGSPIYAGPAAPPVEFVSGDSSPVFLGPGFSGAPGYLNPGFGSLPGFEAPGVKSGDFLIKQAVSTGLAYDSNILQIHSNGPASAIFFVSPGVDIIKDSGRSVQEVTASAVSANYFSSSPDNFTNAFLNVKDTYFLSPTSLITASASFEDGFERRTLTNFLIPTDAASPVPETIFAGGLTYKKFWENSDAGVTLIASEENYGNIRSIAGAPINQEQYDEKDLLINSYFNTQFSSHLRSQLLVQGADISYRDPTLNYTGWRVADTVTADLTSKTGVGMTVGLKEQYFYNNNPPTNTGLLAEYQGNMFWHPTDLLSFQLVGGYRDLGVNYVQGIYGGYAPSLSLYTSYLIWRNLKFDAGINFQENYLPGNPHIEDLLNCTSTLTYEFSAYMGASLQFISQQWLTRPNNTYSFNEDVFQFSLHLRY